MKFAPPSMAMVLLVASLALAAVAIDDAQYYYDQYQDEEPEPLDRSYQTPYMTLPNGAAVYHTPASGGRIRLVDGPASLNEHHPDSDSASPPPEPNTLFVGEANDVESNAPPAGSDDGDGDAEDDVFQENVSDVIYEYLVDISSLQDLTANLIEVDIRVPTILAANVDISDSDPIEVIAFQRDMDYDAMHPTDERVFYEEGEGEVQVAAVDVDADGTTRTRRRRLDAKPRMRRHRRAKDLRLSAEGLCDVIGDGDPSNNSHHPDCKFDLRDGVDYLPPNEYYPPHHFTQRFEYFGGTGLYRSLLPGQYDANGNPLTEVKEATVYLKRLVNENRVPYLSGMVITDFYEYAFGLDPSGEGTRVQVKDPRLQPGMPQPIVVDEEEEEEFMRKLEEEREAKRRLDGENGADNGGERGEGRNDNNDNERDNPFDAQVRAQADRWLEREKRRLQEAPNYTDGSLIDIMVVFTKNALCEEKFGSLDVTQCANLNTIDPSVFLPMFNKAEAAVQYTNQAYLNSKINTQLRLVHTYMVDYDDNGRSCEDAVYELMRVSDGVMDDVHAQRDAWGADLVALLTSNSLRGCGGIAFVGPSARIMFSVTILSGATSGTFAHEVGHNFGCQHDRLNASPGKPYQYGWQDPEARFRTIMAYGCPDKYCPRIHYFSNPTILYDGHHMGDDFNDCARKHNAGIEGVSNYRQVRITSAPTVTHAPSASAVPSADPTNYPTMSPTASRNPSSEPSTSSAPSGLPSEFPTFDANRVDEDFLRIKSPRTFTFDVQRGQMFDVTAKDHDITIHNFRLPFESGGNMTISIWTREEGQFWYEKNNEEAWYYRGSTDAWSPGITLFSPVPLKLRSGFYYGFEPIVIPAGTTKGVYILVNATASLNDNSLAMDFKSGNTKCSYEYRNPFDFDTWIQNEDLAVSDGIYKEKWHESHGTAFHSFRFLGSIYYRSERPGAMDGLNGFEFLPSASPTLTSGPSPQLPSSSPSLPPTDSGAPSASSLPSSKPSTNPSNVPSTSQHPSSVPSVSAKPTTVPTKVYSGMPATEMLDEALLNDLVTAYVTHEDSTCSSEAMNAKTSFSHNFPGTNPASAWKKEFQPYEESLFQTIMTHTDDGTKSWSIRIGTGGNMYSHFTPDMYGETMPPQNHKDAPWIDEVQQSVSVNNNLNLKLGGQYCPGPNVNNKDECKAYFIHQAGAYQRDESQYSDDPFFSPSLAKHCSGNSCAFASWGTQAHVATPFTSLVIYINKYTNCDNGIIEHTQMIHNFADPDAPESSNPQYVDQNYFNVGWGGVRSSSLPHALEPDPSSGQISYANPQDNSHLTLCKWSSNDHDGPENGAWLGARKDLRNLGGYTTFVTKGLLLNSRSSTEWQPWCRKGSDPVCADAKTCMVSSCTQTQVDNENYTRVQLRVTAGQGPNCSYRGMHNGQYLSLKCEMRDKGFGETRVNRYSYDLCEPWNRIRFRNMRTQEELEIAFFRHYSFKTTDHFVYFSIDGGFTKETQQAGINYVNTMFSNLNGADDLLIEVVGTSNPDVPDPYNPGTLDAFTFVYGKGEDYVNSNLGGTARRRIGSTEQSVGARDYTVFTINWWKSGASLQPGSTYVNRGFYFNSKLSNVQTMGDNLNPKTFADKIELGEWNTNRRVDIYGEESSSSFVAVAADVPGGSTDCFNSLSVVCSGFTTPQAGHIPWFYVTCGNSTYLGPDPYHFTPDFGANFPGHGDINKPVRSYVCDGQDPSIRPTWKLLAWMPRSTCDSHISTAVMYNEKLCTPLAGFKAPSSEPSSSLVPSVSSSPSSQPSLSSMPSVSFAPTMSATALHAPTPPPYAFNVFASDGVMFEVYAINENIVIRGLEVSIYTVAEDVVTPEVEVSLYTAPDSYYDENLGDSVDVQKWTYRGTARVTVTPGFSPQPLPASEYSFPIHVPKGSATGIYITIRDPQGENAIISRDDRAGDYLLKGDFYDDDVVVRTGLSKQWNDCLGWGTTQLDYSTRSPLPVKFFGNIFYNLAGRSSRTGTPTHTALTRISTTPSTSLFPSSSPSTSLHPSRDTNLLPSVVPSTSLAPSSVIKELITPQDIEQGNPADGVMFDIVANSTLEVYSIQLGQMAAYPMKIRVYTRIGSHYAVYDDESQWDLIKSYNNYTHDSEDPDKSNRISFPPQEVAVDQTRAFYIAIVDTYGEEQSPLMSGMKAGDNYLTGVWAEDDMIKMMEGVKFYGISEERPFGNGTSTSGVYMHQGPGGTSFNMKDATIRYRPIMTITPSAMPSISQVPSMSQVPSIRPTASDPPSEAPSTSFAPSMVPTGQPSISMYPSVSPSSVPTEQPSISFVPSENPTATTQPSEIPSEEPSIEPTMHPSESPSISSQPSDTPSLEPSDVPSISFQPSLEPSVSLVPTMQQYPLISSEGTTTSGTYGIMFDIIANRAIVVQNFHIDRFDTSASYGIHIFTRPGSYASGDVSIEGWTKITEQSFSSNNQNPVRLTSLQINPVTIYAGQTQAFYIHMFGHYFKAKAADSGDSSSNEDLSLYTGKRVQSQNELFSRAETGFHFQGRVFYSKVSDSPSSAPTELPSVEPTEVPTMAPFSEPSGLPSQAPSTSAAPSPSSEAPSNVPSVSIAPTKNPTRSPTGAPINPTRSPTTPPTISFAPTSAITFAPTPGQARVQITILSSISIGGFETPRTTAQVATIISIVGPTISGSVEKILKTGQRVKSVTIISVNGILVPPGQGIFTTRRLMQHDVQEQQQRRLDNHIDIEYEIALYQLCATEQCSNSQDVANTLYDSVTTEMQKEIDSGAFEDTLEATAALQQITLDASITNNNFSELVVTVLALLSAWYPTWREGEYCENDGNEPWYMKQNGASYMDKSRDGCCSRHYSYKYSSCMGLDDAGAIGYYPAWKDGAVKCLNDTSVPDYMRRNSGQWIYSDVGSCCERYYNWDYDNCILASGGSTITSSTGKWYVNHMDEICQKDCPESVGGACGGNVESWKDLFETETTCCDNSLSWIATSVCKDLSLGLTPTGSNGWYVNFQLEKCVQDCDTSKNAACGGVLMSSHVVLHDTVDSCCSDKLGWVPSKICQATSTNTPITNTGSNNWYVDHKLSRCVQDCKGASPCGGFANNWDQLYNSAGSCCSDKLWWLDGLTSCVKA